MSVKILNIQGGSVGEKAVPAVFSGAVNRHVIWEVVKAEMANRRQGTHKTKIKSEVRGGGAKPWRQKGTGRARQGSIRAPQWAGGGVVFGPSPRDYSEATPQKKKKAGLRNILTEKIGNGKVVLLDEFKLSDVSTKAAYNAIRSVVENSPFYSEYSANRKLKASSNDGRRSITVITDDNDSVTKKSLRNIPWLKTVHIDRLAAVPLFYNHGLIITSGAFDKLAEKVSK